MSALPRRREASVAWELRGAWARLREVVLSVDGGVRVRGYVEHVAPSDAFALVWDGRGEVHVPLARVVAVARPHRAAPEHGDPVLPRRRVPIYVAPPAAQLAFLLRDGCRPR